MSPAAQDVLRRLDAARQQWWLFTLLSTVVLATTASLGTLFLLMLVDALVKFTQVPLLIMLVVWLAVTMSLIVLVFRRLVGSQRSLEAAARCVEAELPDLGSDLINIVQLSSDTSNESRSFCVAAVNEAAARIGFKRFEDAARKESRVRRFFHCMQMPRDLAESLVVFGLLLVLGAACHLMVPTWGSAANRLMTPWKFVPSEGRVKIIKVTPGDTDVLAGEGLEIAAEIVDRDQGDPYSGTLFFTPEGETEQQLSLTPGERYMVGAESGSGNLLSQDAQPLTPAPSPAKGEGSRNAQPLAPDSSHGRGKGSMAASKVRQSRRVYKAALPSVVKPLKYRLEIGDSQTGIYSVGISQKPTLDEVEITLHYPGYLERKPEKLVQKIGDFQAPQYTVAEFHIRPSVPVESGYLDAEGQRFTCKVEDEGKLLSATMPLVKTTTYTIHMFNAQGDGDSAPRLNRVAVLADQPPTVELVKPARESTAVPAGDVPVVIRAADDHGVGRVRLEMKIRDAEPQQSAAKPEAAAPDNEAITMVKNWTGLKFATANLEHPLSLKSVQVEPGQTVMVRAVALDNRYVDEWGLNLKPQEADSGWHTIRLVQPEEKVKAELQQIDSLRMALLKILENQIRAQAGSVLAPRAKTLAECLERAGEVRTLQVDIQKASIDVVKKVVASERPEEKKIKQALGQLAFGDMLQAVKQCDGLVKTKSMPELKQPADELYATQERIVQALSQLLDVARQAQMAELAEAGKRLESDLPDDTKKKLEDLSKSLDKALESQRKVVEASESLAKAPVEDFSEEKEQLLKALALAEDDWSKFMKELNTDLSKLPEQDFANPSLLKELVEIQTEIKMADDALLQKTKDIAVPLEQLGAEMAEEIKTNLEKWLPDTPDRERWSQEESLTDEGKEAPMAELPGELEDIVGELMEEEDSLFDEMEDVSSSAADSLDKGAGWDAADGPISNMSAKGVTGNRLPNSSEIGGRSGEGRSGKSSGEFVGDEAVGKGGRNTPARLTPDAYVAGQIKDYSKDPQGGATGGGKESGQGGEGLEGPSPGNRGPRDLQRLAGKQAALRNKAEGVDLQHFKVAGYHHTDLQKMIETMAQVERDLKSGRYQNAVRQRKVLVDGLKNVKQNLGGEFQIKQDASANLPTDVQKELLGGMQESSPVGWEAMNRAYFERLSKGGAAAPAETPSPSP